MLFTRENFFFVKVEEPQEIDGLIGRQVYKRKVNIA